MFRKKKFQSPLKPLAYGYKLEDYIVGNQIGKGSNAAVYEAAPQFFCSKKSDGEPAAVQIRDSEGEEGNRVMPSLTCCSLRNFPLAIKMLWNFGVGHGQHPCMWGGEERSLSDRCCDSMCLQAGSSNEAIFRSMSHELVPTDPLALAPAKQQLTLDG